MLGAVIKDTPQHFFGVEVGGEDQCHAGIIPAGEQHLSLNDAEQNARQHRTAEPDFPLEGLAVGADQVNDQRHKQGWGKGKKVAGLDSRCHREQHRQRGPTAPLQLTMVLCQREEEEKRDKRQRLQHNVGSVVVDRAGDGTKVPVAAVWHPDRLTEVRSQRPEQRCARADLRHSLTDGPGKYQQRQQVDDSQKHRRAQVAADGEHAPQQDRDQRKAGIAHGMARHVGRDIRVIVPGGEQLLVVQPAHQQGKDRCAQQPQAPQQTLFLVLCQSGTSLVCNGFPHGGSCQRLDR